MLELDFVLEMAAIDDPEHWTFVRAGRTQTQLPEAMARWGDSLTGAMLLRFMARTGLSASINAVAAWRARNVPQVGMKPGITRGGKALGHARDSH